MPKPKDITGNVYGRLTAEYCISSTGKGRLWHCTCTCGGSKEVLVKELTSKSGAKSCGCLQSENAKIQIEVIRDIHVTHGMSKTKVYITWKNMKARCQDKNHEAYNNYGGRGISVCHKWQKFERFLEDMGEPPKGLTLERVDNEGDYCKDNCKWATYKDQAVNRRRCRDFSSKHLGVTFNTAMNKWKGLYKGTHLGYFDTEIECYKAVEDYRTKDNP